MTHNTLAPERAHLGGNLYEIRWGDMDSLGHVNNTVYFRLFEQARIDWLHHHQLYQPGAQHGPVIVNASAEFLQPIHYPATVIVDLYAGPAGRSSFDTYYHISDAAQPDQLYARGQCKVVWVDGTSGKSSALPDTLRQHLPVAADKAAH